MQNISLLCSAVTLASLVACSAATQATGGAQLARPNAIFDPATTYAEFAAWPKAQVDASFKSLQGLSFDQYYGLLTKLSAQGAVVVDGREVNPLAGVEANHDLIVAPGERYRTVGAYWQSLGITSADVSQASYLTAMKELYDSAANLALAGTEVPSSNYQPVSCSPFMKSKFLSVIHNDLPGLINAMNSASDQSRSKLAASPAGVDAYTVYAGYHPNNDPNVTVKVGANAELNGYGQPYVSNWLNVRRPQLDPNENTQMWLGILNCLQETNPAVPTKPRPGEVLPSAS